MYCALDFFYGGVFLKRQFHAIRVPQTWRWTIYEKYFKMTSSFFTRELNKHSLKH